MPSLPLPSYFIVASAGSCGSVDRVSQSHHGASTAISMDGSSGVGGIAAASAAAFRPGPAPDAVATPSAAAVASSAAASAFAAAAAAGAGLGAGEEGIEVVRSASGDGDDSFSDEENYDDDALDRLNHSDLSAHSDEDLARLFARMEARRHREEAAARLDAERESLRMAMEMQAAEEDERERRRRESEMAEEKGWRAAVALEHAANDEEEDRRLAARLMREEEEQRERASELAMAGMAKLQSETAHLALAELSMGVACDAAAAEAERAAAEAAAADLADEADLAAGSTGGPGTGAGVSDDTALRLARAIQAQDEMYTRQHDAAASVALARRLQEQESASPTTFGASAGADASGPATAAVRRKSSRSLRALSDPFPSSFLSEMLSDMPRSDSAADIVRAALHHGPLRLRQEEAWSRLTPRQREAIGYVDCIAQSLHEEAMPALRDRVLNLGYSIVDLETCLAYIRDDAPIIIHLKERTLEHLCCDPWYRSQFETGTSGGTLDRRRRQRWEDAMFGAAYADAPDDEHPKYGCLNITGDILGVRGARGYGKLYLTLAPSVRHRTSFSNKDTGQQAGKSKMATNNWYGHVLAEYSDDELRTVFRVSGSVGSRLSGAPSSAFSQYKECQIHGTLSMAADVLALSVPAKRADAEGSRLANLVEEFRQISGCTILWQGDLLGD